MLIQFHVENWCSFKERATLDLSATTDEHLSTNIIQTSDTPLLRSAAVYGANGSGKSNLLEAMFFMRRFVLSSAINPEDQEIDIEPFLLSEGQEEKPSLFEMHFIEKDHVYRYGFQVDRRKIHCEWLYLKTSSKETRLFLRKDQVIKINLIHFKEGKGLEDKTKTNRLFISVCEQLNGDISGEVVSWFRRLRSISGINDRIYLSFTSQAITQTSFKNHVVDLLRRANMPFLDIRAEKSKTERKVQLREILTTHLKVYLENEIKTIHKFYGKDDREIGTKEFDLKDFESEGSKKFTALSGPLVEALLVGGLLVIDELEARLHPLLTRFIVSQFAKSRNNAQLIFTTHDTNLLSREYFRRDQVWFTEMDKCGASHLYSLAEFKVRSDASFGKDYILGKYGAIPFIGESSFSD